MTHWTAATGTAPTLPRGLLVDYRRRGDRPGAYSRAPAHALAWSHTGTTFDIVEYRVSQPDAPLRSEMST